MLEVRNLLNVFTFEFCINTFKQSIGAVLSFPSYSKSHNKHGANSEVGLDFFLFFAVTLLVAGRKCPDTADEVSRMSKRMIMERIKKMGGDKQFTCSYFPSEANATCQGTFFSFFHTMIKKHCWLYILQSVELERGWNYYCEVYYHSSIACTCCGNYDFELCHDYPVRSRQAPVESWITEGHGID